MQNQNPYQFGSSQDDPLQIGLLVSAIQHSPLPEAKKLAYLYMIAEGSFSDLQLKTLLAEMKAAEKKLKAKIERRKKKISRLDEEIEHLEKNILEVTPKAVQETQHNLDLFLEAVHEKAEAADKNSADRSAAAIKTKMKFS